jgi:epsilon-lactone hydrolase
MASLPAHFLKLGLRARVKRRPQSGPALVRHLRATLGAPFPPRLPKGVRLERFEADGVRGEVVRVASPRQLVLYFHGGGYIAGRPSTYRTLAGELAEGLDAEVLMPSYRLAPEAPFPAAIEDALSAYDYARARGYTPSQISFGGDSAGGGLALGTLLALRDRGDELPKCAVVFSPFADMTLSGASITENDLRCDMFTTDLIRAGLGLYARVDHMRHPHASPVFGDFSGLPPLFITVAEHECLRDDAYGVAARAREAGVQVELLSREDLPHVWPIFTPYIPEAKADVARAIAFVKRF